MQNEIVNRVTNSGLITFDLEEYYNRGERVLFDIKAWLFQEQILKEKDFREHVKNHDWSQYQMKNVAVHCSADAIIPTWAFMLVVIHLEPYANRVIYGNLDQLENTLFQEALIKVDLKEFENARVVIKGCGHFPIPEFAYVEITNLLRSRAASIMYGEPCSTVPLYKRPKK